MKAIIRWKSDNISGIEEVNCVPTDTVFDVVKQAQLQAKEKIGMEPRTYELTISRGKIDETIV